MFYCGIGSRATPPDFCEYFTEMAKTLEQYGFTLRSGGAEKADTAFALGTMKREIYIPWWGFNQIRTKTDKTIITMDDVSPELLFQSRKLFEAHHPNPKACSAVAQILHMRNGFQVLGRDLLTPVKFVLCWTPEGKSGGGTGQAIRIAKAHNIPVYDFGRSDWNTTMMQQLETQIQGLMA